MKEEEPVETFSQEGIYRGQETLSQSHRSRVEQQQQICSVSELKTNTEASVFLAVEQLVYFQEFSPRSVINLVQSIAISSQNQNEQVESFSQIYHFYLLAEVWFMPNKCI